MGRNDKDADKTRIIAGAIIQMLALIVLGVVIWIDSSYPDTDFQEIELLLGGIAAAPAAGVLAKQFKRDGDA
jgi:hypothetical protein